jgi:GH18 family chitinase
VFSELARSEAHQSVFLKSLTSFLSTYDIDGVDINWEHPDGSTDDYENLPRLLQNIRATLSMTAGRYGLSMTLPVSLPALHNYNLRRLTQHVDYFNLMPVDLHTQLPRDGDTWKGETLGPVVNMTQVSGAVDLLWQNHIAPYDVNLGLALYGSSLVPEDPACVRPGCPVARGAAPGYSSRRRGMLMNSEIQDLMNHEPHEWLYGTRHHSHDWVTLQPPLLDTDAGVKIAMNEKQWIAYDDWETLKLKLDFARKSCFGGVTAWAITHDTYNGDYAKILDCLLVKRRKSLGYHYCDDILI